MRRENRKLKIATDWPLVVLRSLPTAPKKIKKGIDNPDNLCYTLIIKERYTTEKEIRK